jgi:hypothetical protein
LKFVFSGCGQVSGGIKVVQAFLFVFNHGSPNQSNIEFTAFGSISLMIDRMVLHTKKIEGIFWQLFYKLISTKSRRVYALTVRRMRGFTEKRPMKLR